MEKYLKRIKPRYYWLIAFCLTAITYALAFSYLGLLSNGKYIIARSDLKQQYIPFIQYFCNVLRGKHDYWYSWALNMGSGTSLMFAYYSLSPFNLLFLLFNNDMVMTATALVIILKASTAAATFQIFIVKYYKKACYETIFFSMMYALCGFQVCYYFSIIWMDAFYMLPVIAIGIMKLVKEEKSFFLLLSYAYVFGTNFYAGYIVGVSSFFLFLFYYAYHFNGKEKRVNIKIIFKYGLSVICAIAMTTIIWLPAVIQLLQNIDENYPEFQLASCNLLFVINNLFIGQMQTLEGVTPFIYCGLLSMLLLPFFFMNKQIRKKERIYIFICLSLFVCLVLVAPLNKLMHAFDNPEMFRHRFSYAISFIIVTVSFKQFLYLRQIEKKKLYLVTALYVILFVINYFLYEIIWDKDYNANNFLSALVNGFFLALWIYVFFKNQKKKWDVLTFRTVITFLVMVELGVNAIICIERMEHKATKQIDYEMWTQLEEKTMKIIEKENNGDFTRILFLNPRGQNDAFTYDYNSFTGFNSSEHKKMLQALEKLGFYRGVHVVNGTGSTPVTRSLLNIGYAVGGMSLAGDLNGLIYLNYEKNERNLSLGYMVKDEIKKYKFTESPFENQDRLISMMTGRKFVCFERTGMEMNVENGIYAKGDGITYLLHEEIDESRETEEKEAKFIFKADDNGKPLYVYFLQDRYMDKTGGAEIPWIETQNKSYMNENLMFQPKLVPARIVQVGLNDEKQYEFSIVVPKELEGDYYKKAFFYYYDDSEFDKAFHILEKQQWNIEKFHDGHIKGSIRVEESGVMFTSIPFDAGWKIMVDGSPADAVELLEGAFLGVELDLGAHEIEMWYEAPGKKVGEIISIGTLIFLGISGIWIKSKKSIRK